MKYKELPKKLYLNDFEMNLPNHYLYYIFYPGHGIGCTAMRKAVREKNGYSLGEFIKISGADVCKVGCINEHGCFPEFERKEDLLKFINLLDHVGIVTDRDGMERQKLGIHRKN